MQVRKLYPVLVIAAGLLAYSNSFTGGFFWDDVWSILRNPTIRHLWPIWNPLLPLRGSGWTVAGRPLVNLSLAINYALGGFNVWGYHALNLTVHILAGLALYGIVRRTLVRPKLPDRFGAVSNELALAIAVLWMVHPLQTQSVTYIVQRAESIMGLCYLVTLYCFIRGAESQQPRLWHGLSVTACALGMASKEVMVSAPLMVPLYDRAFLSGSFREAWRRRWPQYLALATTWIVLSYVVISADSFATTLRITKMRWTRWEYLATQMNVILYYLRLSLWPTPFSLGHPWPIAKTWMSILPPTAVVVTLLVASAWAWRRNPSWGFVGVWFFLILAPSSSFIPLNDLVFEHRMYLSLAAVVSLVVLGVYSVVGRQSLTVFAVVAIGLGFLTWRQNQTYRMNPYSSLGFALQNAGRTQEAIGCYEQALRVRPDDAPTHFNLATALEEGGRVQEAIGQYEQALQLNPNYPEAHNNLGLALERLGRTSEAIEHYERALRLNPNMAEAHNNLGLALAGVGRTQEAVEHCKQALRIDPYSAETYNNFGIVLAGMGKLPEAAALFEQALRIKPGFAEAHDNLGRLLKQAGKTEQAIEHYEQALRIRPDYAEAHNNLGNSLLQLGRINTAIAHYEQALQIKPDFVEAHYNLGVALERMGRVQEAIGHYEQALRIKPDFAEAQKALARLQAAQ